MKLMIYCAGGAGKEVYDLAIRINNHHKRWDAIEFIDDVIEEKLYYGAKINTFDEIKDTPDKSDMECIIANGEPAVREILWNRLLEHGFNMTNLIDPFTNFSPHAKVGKGVIAQGLALVSSDCVIGNNVYLQPITVIGHDTVIGDHCVICIAMIAGHCTIGKRVFIGINASIKDRITVGADAIIGMGSAIFKDIPEKGIVMGNPGRVIKYNEQGKVF